MKASTAPSSGAPGNPAGAPPAVVAPPPPLSPPPQPARANAPAARKCLRRTRPSLPQRPESSARLPKMRVMAVRQPRGEERQGHILRAALTLIHREGVGAVTHRTVADEAGVALGSLTYYFPTKDELLREALLLFVEEEVARLRVLAAALNGGSRDPEQ